MPEEKKNSLKAKSSAKSKRITKNVEGPQKIPFVSIICPVKNAERTIDTTMQYLLNVDYPRDKMEIILADGGSNDGTIDIIKRWQEKYQFIKLVEVKNSKSPGFARNAALKIATGDFILFTDADCAPHKDWIHKILAPFFKDPKIGLVGGEIFTLRTDSSNDVESYCEQVKFLTIGNRVGMQAGGYYPDVKKYLPSEVNGSQTCPFFATANAAISKKALDSIGRKFWDEITAEDVDFSLRIMQKGYKIFFEPSAIVDHMHRATPEQFYKQLWGYGFGHPLLVKTYAKNILEIYLQYFGGISIPIPVSPSLKGIIYIGNFHLMHIFAIVSIIKVIINALVGGIIRGLESTIILLIITLFFAFLYFLPILMIKPLNKFFTWAKIRYLSNFYFIKGGFDGVKKFGTVTVESSW